MLKCHAFEGLVSFDWLDFVVCGLCVVRFQVHDVGLYLVYLFLPLIILNYSLIYSNYNVSTSALHVLDGNNHRFRLRQGQ